MILKLYTVFTMGGMRILPAENEEAAKYSIVSKEGTSINSARLTTKKDIELIKSLFMLPEK